VHLETLCIDTADGALDLPTIISLCLGCAASCSGLALVVGALQVHPKSNGLREHHRLKVGRYPRPARLQGAFASFKRENCQLEPAAVERCYGCAVSDRSVQGEAEDLRKRPLHERVERGFLLFLGIWAAAFVGRYLFIAYHTVGYPFQLEWMEGGTLDVVTRIRAGDAIYTAPSVDYVPYIYTPFYYVASTLSSYLLGVELLCARMVSLAGTLGAGALIHLLVYRETKSHAWGLVGVGLFLATYDASGKWFHLARVDSLALFFVLASFALLRMRRGWESALAAGVLAWLAVFTKQTMLAPIGLVLLAAFFVDRRRSVVAGATLGALCLGSLAAFELSSDGWFSYYTLWLPSAHPTAPSSIRNYFVYDVRPFTPAVIIGLVWLGLALRSDRRATLMYGGLVLGCLGASFLSRSHVGGYRNVLMPAHAALALMAAIAAPALIRIAKKRGPSWAKGLSISIAVLLGIQLGTLEYRVDRCLPPPDAEQVGNAFLERLAEIEGDVLLPDHRWLQTRMGKRSYGLGMAARDVLRAHSPKNHGRDLLNDSLAEAIGEQRFEAVILSERCNLPDLPKHYRRAESIESPSPITGWLIHPKEVWRPRSSD